MTDVIAAAASPSLESERPLAERSDVERGGVERSGVERGGVEHGSVEVVGDSVVGVDVVGDSGVAGRTAAVVGDAAGAVGETARTVASRSAAAAGAAAGAAASGVRGGLREASRRLDDERAEWDRTAERSALPDVTTVDPMADLAIRLDREADFWRGFAIQALRPGPARAIGISAAVLGAIGGVALATLGGLGDLLGAEASADHLTAATIALATGATSAVIAAAWLDRSTKGTAADALARADGAERRLQRVAAILALRVVDAQAYKDALARFERG